MAGRKIKFVKMHGSGNDYVIVDARAMGERDWPQMAASACDRHYGIGADGLILVLSSQVADFRMRMFNPDGSEAEMCGNGIRCFAKYVLEEGLLPEPPPELAVETLAGIRNLRPTWAKGQVALVRVNMGRPEFLPSLIPMAASELESLGKVMDYSITVKGMDFRVSCVSMGNPHAVYFTEKPVGDFPLEEIGPLVEHHPIFPNRVNFEVAQVVDRGHIAVRVWERGAGPTLACGTGACAVAVIACTKGLADSVVDITLPGGTLTMEWDGVGEVLMTGPVLRVFEGEWGARIQRHPERSEGSLAKG